MGFVISYMAAREHLVTVFILQIYILNIGFVTTYNMAGREHLVTIYILQS